MDCCRCGSSITKFARHSREETLLEVLGRKLSSSYEQSALAFVPVAAAALESPGLGLQSACTLHLGRYCHAANARSSAAWQAHQNAFQRSGLAPTFNDVIQLGQVCVKTHPQAHDQYAV